MRTKAKLLATVITLCAVAPGDLWGAPEQRPESIISIDEIRPGMTGHGLTVFSGFEVERFQVKVIDVMRNFLPKQDLILISVDHPRLRQTGVVGGMSGSPIYIGGKLAGALAYGWRFAKEPIAGVTPIADMLKILDRTERGPQQAGYAARQAPHQRTRLAAASGGATWWRRMFPRPRQRSETMLQPVAVPLSAAGFAGRSMDMLEDAFQSYGFTPVQGGGTGKAEGPTKLAPGSAIGVQLVSGDMSLTSTGTVTWTGLHRILAFGHQMFNAGEIYITAVSARIHHMLASLSRSFKLSSPARVIGSLIQDRQGGIMVDTGRKIESVPMTVTMRYMGRKEAFRTDLAHHRLLTPTLATTVMASALAEQVADVTHATMKVTTRIAIQGQKDLVVEDYLYAPTGARMSAVMFSEGLRALAQVMNNEFQPVIIERIDTDVSIDFSRDVVEIIGVALNSSAVDPGARINLTVTFRPYAGSEFTKTYPLTIPRSLAGSLLQVEVATGAKVKPEQAPPQNLADYLVRLAEGYPARSVVISLRSPTYGMKLRGRVIRDLPASVIDALNTASQVRQEDLFQTASRAVHGTRRLVVGKKQMRIRVRSEVQQ